MRIEKQIDADAQFEAGAWATLLIAVAIILYGVVDFSYRLTLPTDGWLIGEAGDSVIRDIAGINPGLQEGDIIISIGDVLPEAGAVEDSAELRARWQVGETLDYRVLRTGEDLVVPVTLGNWPMGAAFFRKMVDPATAVDLVVAVIEMLLAVLVFFRRPGSPSARAFMMIMLFFVGTTISELVPFTYNNWIDPIARLLQGGFNWFLLSSLFPYSLILFALTFPKPRPVYLRYPWLPALVGGIGLVTLLFVAVSPLAWYWFVLSLLLTVGILIHGAFTVQGAVSRAQIRWGVGGFVVGLGPLTVMFVLNTTGILSIPLRTFGIANPILGLIMTGMLAMGILRYRLFDIDIIIRRTLQYTLLTGVLVVLYYGGIVVLQGVLRPITGDTNSPLITVVTTLGIAALFNPLRHCIQDFIDRRFFRNKYDAQKTLSGFSSIARDEVDMGALSEALIAVVEDTMQPDHTSLWLSEKTRRRPSRR